MLHMITLTLNASQDHSPQLEDILASGQQRMRRDAGLLGGKLNHDPTLLFAWWKNDLNRG